MHWRGSRPISKSRATRSKPASLQQEAQILELLQQGRHHGVAADPDLTTSRACADRHRRRDGADRRRVRPRSSTTCFDGVGDTAMLYTLSGVPRTRSRASPCRGTGRLSRQTFNGEGIDRVWDDIPQLGLTDHGRNEPHHGSRKEHLPVRSHLAAPVRVAPRARCWAGFSSGIPSRASSPTGQSASLVGIAAQAAIAIDNARLYRPREEIAEHADEPTRACRNCRIRRAAPPGPRRRAPRLAGPSPRPAARPGTRGRHRRSVAPARAQRRMGIGGEILGYDMGMRARKIIGPSRSAAYTPACRRTSIRNDVSKIPG